MELEEFEVTESSALAPIGKRWKARLIKAGWGAQMYYPAEVLQRDGSTVFKAGTPIFLDHQTAEEKASKPFGSVQNFAGILATDAVWDAEEQSLFAEVEIFEHHQSAVKAMAEHVGLSIRAQTNFYRGTEAGRGGRIAESLLSARSVDLVVRAGAGGGLVEVLESAQIEIIEGTENMDETKILEAITALGEATNARITEVQESLLAEINTKAEKVESEEVVVEEAVAPVTAISDEDRALMEAFIAAKGAPVESEETAAVEGIVEDEGDVEESAKSEITLPSAWVVKGNK